LELPGPGFDPQSLEKATLDTGMYSPYQNNQWPDFSAAGFTLPNVPAFELSIDI
jgi:hypothetical protein